MEKFAIIFGQEELLYLLRSLGLPDLPGMGEQPWGEITREASVLVLDAVGRSLFGRGIVSLDTQGKIVVDKTVMAILAASAYADQIVLLSHIGPEGQAQQINYYRVPEFDVCQLLMLPWLYRFELQTETDFGRHVVQQWIAPVQSDFSTSVVPLKQEALDQALQAAPENPSLAADILDEAGVEKSIAFKFADSLAAPVLSLRFQSVETSDKQVKRNIFSILAGKDACWLVTGDASDGIISLKAISTSELQRIITIAYLPFQAKKQINEGVV